MNLEELFNILKLEKPSDELRKREEDLFKLIPQLEKCKGFEQHSDWHIYDVLEHIYHVVDNTPNRLPVRLTSLFHDCEKPLCFIIDKDGKGHFKDHWYYGKKAFDNFAKEHDIDPELAAQVSKLILYHDIDLINMSQDNRLKMKIIFDADGLQDLFDLKEADLLAQNPKYHYLLNDLHICRGEFLNSNFLRRP